MKASFRFLASGLFVLLGVFGTSQTSAVTFELGADYPNVMGKLGQAFNSNIGVSGAIYLDPIIDPKVNNFLSVGYTSLTVRADTKASYRIIPILVGLELPGKVNDTFTTTFAGAVGGSVAFLNVPNSQNMNPTGYFTAQLRGGIEAQLSSNLSLYARTPVTFLLTTNTLTYISYSLGLGYTL